MRAKKLCSVCDRPRPRKGIRFPTPEGIDLEFPLCTMRCAYVFNRRHSADIIVALWPKLHKDNGTS